MLAHDLLDKFLKHQEEKKQEQEGAIIESQLAEVKEGILEFFSEYPQYDAIRVWGYRPVGVKELENEGFIVLPQPNETTIIALRSEWTHLGDL